MFQPTIHIKTASEGVLYCGTLLHCAEKRADDAAADSGHFCIPIRPCSSFAAVLSSFPVHLARPTDTDRHHSSYLMSFLDLEDDPLATLEEALAFIDACDDQEDVSASGSSTPDAISTTSSSSNSTSTTGSGSSDDDAPAVQDTSLKVFIRRTPSGKLSSQHHYQQPYQQVQPLLPQQPKPGTNPSSGMSSNRAKSFKKHRERKKNEMLTLRDQVTQLETTLAHLRRVMPRSIGCLEAAETGGTGGGRTSLHLLLEARIASPNTSESERDEAKSAYRALLALQPASRDTTTISKPASSTTSSWLNVAATQASERYASEVLNLRLKEALQTQLQMAQALQGALGRTRAEGLDLLLDHQRDELMLHIDDPLKAPPGAASGSAESLSAMDQLYAGMHQMYISTESVIGKQSEADWSGAISSSPSRVKQEDVRIGMCIELTSTTLLYCAFQEAGRTMWQRMSQIKQASKHPEKPWMERQELTSDSFVTKYLLVLGILSGDDNQPLTLQCTSYMRKFDESDRFMVMWYSTVNLPDSGLTFTEKGWIVAMPNLNPATASSKTETEPPSPSTIVKTCHQVSSAPQGPQVSEETKELIALVLRTLSRKTREYHQLMQDLLLDQFSGTSTTGQPKVLPTV